MLLHLSIKMIYIQNIENIYWKTFKACISFKRDSHVYTDLCDKLHEQHVSDIDKSVQVYFYWCLPRQYLHSLHNCK